MKHELEFRAYCGMSYVAAEGDRQECRSYAAKLIRLRRKRGHVISVQKPGACWEIGEPEDCVMVPDTAGMLYLRALPEPEPEFDEEEDLPCCQTCGEPLEEWGEDCPVCDKEEEEDDGDDD